MMSSSKPSNQKASGPAQGKKLKLVSVPMANAKPEGKVKIIGFSCVKHKTPQAETKSGVIQNDTRSLPLNSVSISNSMTQNRCDYVEQTNNTATTSQEQAPSHDYNCGKDSVSTKTPQGKGKSSLRNRSEKQSNLVDDTTDSNSKRNICNCTVSLSNTIAGASVTSNNKSPDDRPADQLLYRSTASEVWASVQNVQSNVLKKLFGIHPSRFGIYGEPLVHDDDNNTDDDEHFSSTWDRTASIPSLTARRVQEKASGVSVWDSIPAKDCDIVLVFPINANIGTLTWLRSCLRVYLPSLILDIRYHPTASFYTFCLTEAYNDLLRGAEELGIRKPLRLRYGGGITEFVYAERHRFSGIEQPAYFLTSQERQTIVRHTLFKLRSDGSDTIGNFTFDFGQPIIPHLLVNSIINYIVPLHDIQEINYLRANWIHSNFPKQPLDAICSYFGVKIAMYFAYMSHYTYALAVPGTAGVLCWALSGHSQQVDDFSFIVFSLGNFLWPVLYLEHWKRRCATYAYRWGTIDVKDEQLIEPRPLFHGELRLNPITNEMEFFYPTWKRTVFRCLVTFPMMTFSLCIVFLVTWLNLEFQASFKPPRKPDSFSTDNMWPVINSYMPKVLLAICVIVCGEIYKKLAYWLNNKENYRDDDSYERNMTVKIVLFEFVNSFLALFYFAFYLHDMEQLQQQLAMLLITRQLISNVQQAIVPFIMGRVYMFALIVKASVSMTMSKRVHYLVRAFSHICFVRMDELHNGLETDLDLDDEDTNWTVSPRYHGKNASVQVANSPENLNKSVLNPLTICASMQSMIPGEDVTLERRLHRFSSDIALTQVEMESSMQWCEGPFEDHLKMFIQFGYVTVFSSAYPPAAMWALLDNIIDMSVSSTKYCLAYQRPFGQRVASIGAWQSVLEMVSITSIITNCILIGMSDLGGRFFPRLLVYERILAMIFFEHLILALWLGIYCVTPKVPVWVAEEKARLEHRRREALKKLNRMPKSRFGLAVADKRHIVEDDKRAVWMEEDSTNPMAQSSMKEPHPVYMSTSLENKLFQHHLTS